jgi:hypothetical protein
VIDVTYLYDVGYRIEVRITIRSDILGVGKPFVDLAAIRIPIIHLLDVISSEVNYADPFQAQHCPGFIRGGRFDT